MKGKEINNEKEKAFSFKKVTLLLQIHCQRFSEKYL